MNNLETIIVLTVIALTTMIFYLAAKRLRPEPAESIAQAFRAFLDWAGLFVLFIGSNLFVGFVVILAVRGLTPRFVTVYSLENVIMLVLSAAQAFVFQMWWKGN